MAHGRAHPREVGREGDPFDWHLRIPNRLELVQGLRSLLAATLEGRGVDEEDAQEIFLVVSEIVNNSIEHVQGRGPDGYHEVEIRFGVAGDRVVGTVLDEGEGGIGQGDFEAASAPGLETDRGRGLFLIQAYVDALTVTPLRGVGTEIRFEKRVRLRAGERKA
jgi:anti-sigma regulatory factor (Ser/Thr protein kinase)